MAGYFYPQSYVNPYLPTFYPQMVQPQQAQPQPAPQQAAQPPQPQPTGILWVPSEADAQAYPVAPNAAVALWDSNSPTVYIKQADASGKPVLKVYDLTERVESSRKAFPGAGDTRIADTKIKSEIDALWSAVGEIRSRIGVPKRETAKTEAKNDDAE